MGETKYSFDFKASFFNINQSIEKGGLAMNIDTDNNALDFELAKSVGVYFKLTNS
jgi:serine/threonine-protein kinase HipA